MCWAAGSSLKTAGNTTVASGAALQVGSGTNFTIADAIVLNGTGIADDGALRKIGSNTTSLSGVITVATASRINSDAGILNITGAPTLTATATFGGAGNTTITGIISSAGGINKDGAGTLTLNTATNAFTGQSTSPAACWLFDSTDRITSTRTSTVTINGGTLRGTSTGVAVSS